MSQIEKNDKVLKINELTKNIHRNLERFIINAKNSYGDLLEDSEGEQYVIYLDNINNFKFNDILDFINKDIDLILDYGIASSLIKSLNSIHSNVMNFDPKSDDGLKGVFDAFCKFEDFFENLKLNINILKSVNDKVVTELRLEINELKSEIEKQKLIFIRSDEKDNYNNKIFNFYEKIENLILIEELILDFEEMIFNNQYEVVDSADFTNKMAGFRKYCKEFISRFHGKESTNLLLNMSSDDVVLVLKGLKKTKEKEFYNDLELQDSFRIMRESFLNLNNIGKELTKDPNILIMLKIYESRKDKIYYSRENLELNKKIKKISFIDEAITKDNEIYNKNIAKLIKVEEGFERLYADLSQFKKEDFFSDLIWKLFLERKGNVKFIVNKFQDESIHKFLLLLDINYIESVISYLFDRNINGRKIEINKDESLEFIRGFYNIVNEPYEYVNAGRYNLNTPLMNFNVNYYRALKDYKLKIRRIESSEDKLKEAISLNGEYSKKVESFVKEISDKNQSFYTQLTNVLASNKVVESIVDDIKNSKSFIDEVEGLYINNETRKVYKTVYDEEIKIANNFRLAALCIYGFLGFVACISLLILLFEPSNFNSNFIDRFTKVDTLLIKISLILTLAFVGIYLSREGEKHRRIANQARQTMNELHAFVSYSSDIKDKIPEIKTKLADKYFGKTLYETEKAMTPDSDVLKSVLDQTKAATDLVKAFKGTVIHSPPPSQDKAKGQSDTV